MHGNGIFLCLWANGKMHGKGALINPNGSLLKKGIWKNGIFDHFED